MLLLNMLSEAEKEVNGRKRFRSSFGFIARYTNVSIVMEGHCFAVIGVDTGGADTGTAKITSHIFDELFQIVITLKIFRRGSRFDVEALGILFSESHID